ncbi:MAG: hypothetical protein DRQ14_08090, partial [Candidatus Latescibacterota bacterium]
CSDDSPNGWGNFGCRRCQAIVDLQETGRKIWPRNKSCPKFRADSFAVISKGCLFPKSNARCPVVVRIVSSEDNKVAAGILNHPGHTLHLSGKDCSLLVPVTKKRALEILLEV